MTWYELVGLVRIVASVVQGEFPYRGRGCLDPDPWVAGWREIVGDSARKSIQAWPA
jgi:hypothetical protein